MKKLLTLIIILLAVTLMAQDKPEIKPSVRLELQDVQLIILKIDSIYTAVIRSDMAKPERNSSSDKLVFISLFLTGKFNEQNPVKADSVKVIPNTKKQ